MFWLGFAIGCAAGVVAALIGVLVWFAAGIKDSWVHDRRPQ